MLEKVNGGDQEALKAFLQTYAKHIFERAKSKAPDESVAREATRIAVLKIRQAAKNGEVPSEPAPWIDKVTDESVQRLILPLGTAKKQQAAQQTAKPAAQPRMQQPVQAPIQPRMQQPAQAPVQPRMQHPVQAPVQQYVQPPVQQARPIHTSAPEEQRQRTRRCEDANAPQRIPALFGDDPAEAPVKKKEDAPVGMVLLIFLLVLIVLGLIWMLLVMLMSKGYLPVMDFGFAQWFNTNVFQLF